MKFSVITLGCKANQSESNYIENILSKKHYSKVTLEEKPDICLINSCSVTSKSDNQSKQLIRQAINSGAKVYVTGCYSEINHEEIKTINKDISIIDNNKKLEFFNTNIDSPFYEFNHAQRKRSRAMVKIHDGCNSSCTYCVIPKARGMSNSRITNEIINEIKYLEDHGYNEVVLTGIHIGYYGSDLNPKVKLSELVYTILRYCDNIRIRLSSLEVNEITDEIICLLKEDRVCKHLHVPLQSGDDKILKKMNRPYGSELFKKRILTLHNINSNILIGADVIVGFPGENPRNFENTYNFISNLPLNYLHVFPFSKRKHTKAFYFPNQVDIQTKKGRAAMLRELSVKKKNIFMEGQIGKRVSAIVEKFDGTYFHATTDNYLKIRFYNSRKQIIISEKSLINLIVTGIENGLLTGQVILDS